MSPVSSKIVVSHHRKESGVRNVQIRVTYKRISRYLSTNYWVRDEDITSSLKIKNQDVLLKTNELHLYIQKIISEINIFALENMSIDDIVTYIKAKGTRDSKDLIGYQYKSTEDTSTISTLEEITDGMKPCYVYLMRDNSSHLYKIGISNEPNFREKTLLGQIPKVVLLYAKQFPTRRIALVIEKVLHTVYQQFHTRGEWYKLSDKEITEVKSILT